MAYTEAYQATGDALFRQTAEEIFTYIHRDMTDADGGFYSAEDADSEGEEGKFYVWTPEELTALLGAEDAAWVIEHFQVTPEGNFVEEATGERLGTSILHLTEVGVQNLAKQTNDPHSFSATWARIRPRLFAERVKRIPPLKDDKILTDWNGLMIAALAKATQAFGDPAYAERAERAVAFIWQTLRDEQGRLLHRYRTGTAGLPASVDDYAFLIWGLIELYQATFKASYLEKALDLQTQLDQHFWDETDGGYFFTPDDGEALLMRTKEHYDGAVPSGNAVAMGNLVRLGRMMSQPAFEEKSAAMMRLFATPIREAPTAHTFFLMAHDFAQGPTAEIVLAGDEVAAFQHAVLAPFLPHQVVLHRPESEDDPIFTMIPFLRQQPPLNGQPTAYICEHFVCQKPVTELADLHTALGLAKVEISSS